MPKALCVQMWVYSLEVHSRAAGLCATSLFCCDTCVYEPSEYKEGGGFCVGNSSESVQCLYNWLMIVLLSSEGLEELLSLSFLVPLQYNI